MLDNLMGVPAMSTKKTKQDASTAGTAAEEIRTLDSHMPAPPALDLGGK